MTRNATFIYKEIIVRCCREIIPNHEGYRITSKKMNAFLSKYKIRIRVESSFLDNLEKDNPMDNYVYCTYSYHKKKQYNKVVSIFLHLRNSFAHARVQEIENGKYIYMEDYDTHRNVITMKSQIEKRLFRKFMEALVTLTK